MRGWVGVPGCCSFKPPPHNVPGPLEAGEGSWKRCGQAWLAATKPNFHQNRPTADAMNLDTRGPSRPCARGPVTQRGAPDSWPFVRSKNAFVRSWPCFLTLRLPMCFLAHSSQCRVRQVASRGGTPPPLPKPRQGAQEGVCKVPPPPLPPSWTARPPGRGRLCYAARRGARRPN